MGKKYMATWAIFLTLIFLPSIAFSWGFATHAYVDDRLNKKWGFNNRNEIYGGMTPDVFGIMFNYPAYREYLYFQSHNEFLRIWDEARSRQGKALAYGFVSHNDTWGADFTAHHAGITFGQGEGYIVTKAKILQPELERTLRDIGLVLPDGAYLDVSHFLMEIGGDMLLKRKDPMIGQKIIASSVFHNQELPILLVKAYGRDFSQRFGISYPEAAGIITAAEREFRKTMTLYGQALTQDEGTTIQLISVQIARFAKDYLALYEITLPEGVDLIPLIKSAIERSIELCAGDFDAEVEATINYVNQQLILHGISYRYNPQKPGY